MDGATVIVICEARLCTKCRFMWAFPQHHVLGTIKMVILLTLSKRANPRRIGERVLKRLVAARFFFQSARS